jgi:hypothetical protein
MTCEVSGTNSLRWFSGQFEVPWQEQLPQLMTDVVAGFFFG